MESSVTLSVDSGVGLLLIRRPAARNALTWAAMDAFAAGVEAAAGDPSLRALIVAGEGQAFCAGGDLFELDGYPTRADGVRLSTVMADALDRLEALPVPTIAAIEGPALGGGAEIALACDLRIAAEGASFGLMHVRLGISPAWGGGQRLLRLVGYSRTVEWLALGKVMAASELLEAGLCNRVVPRGQALEEARAIASQLSRYDAQAVAAAKRVARAGVTLPAEAAARTEREVFPGLWSGPAHLAASAAFVAGRNHRPRPRS